MIEDMSKIKWHKIHAPVTWRPKEGDELLGYYCNRTKKDGRFGQYEVLIVLVPRKGAFIIGGTKLIQLADAAMLSYGDPLKIKYLGKKDIGDDRQMKNFEMYIGEQYRRVVDLDKVKEESKTTKEEYLPPVNMHKQEVDYL